MLDLSTAVLCDFAQVRDRLLFVSSGAVSRLYRQELPSPLGLMVGLVIEVPLEDAGMEHQLRAEVINRHGTVLATLENTFRVSDVGLFPHEVQQVPLVLSITGVRARTWGTHQVRLYLDNELVRALTLYVVPAAGPQATVRATPTQSRVDDDEGSLGGGPGEASTPDPDEERPPAPEPPADEDADRSHQVLLERDDLEAIDAPIVLDEGMTAAPAPQPQPQPAPQPAPQPLPAQAFEPPTPAGESPSPDAPDAPPAPAAPAPAFPAPAPAPAAPAPAPAEPLHAAAPPGADDALDWGTPPAAPAGEPISAPQPPATPPSAPPAAAPQAPPPQPRPVIDAPPAVEPAPAPAVFDYEDQDDLDRDPTPSDRERDPSRFSFRYLLDDE